MVILSSKGELSKQRILQASIGLFSKRAFADVTVRHIAKDAGVSPGLIYKYYENQEELYYEAMKSASHAFIEGLAPISDLDEFVNFYLEHMFRSEVLFGMMTHFMMDNERPPHRMPITSDVAKLLNLIEEKIPTPDARIEAQLLFSTMNGLLISYRKIPNQTTDEALRSIQRLSSYYLEHLKKRMHN